MVCVQLILFSGVHGCSPEPIHGQSLASVLECYPTCGRAWGAAIDLSHHASYTLEDDRLEPTNHPFSKENDLCKPP